MTGTDFKQRLAAILVADVAGFSRLMAGDDRATVAALDAARSVFRMQVEANQGRVIDMAGDSVLAVFDTATGAMGAALAIQGEIDASGQGSPEDRRMRFRIGIHLGDVIEKPDGTVYGDGVNIAARLEGLAEPGGITVSDAIRSAVKGRVHATFEDQGEQSIKNLPDPVHAHRVRVAGAVAGATLALPDKPSIAVLPFTNMSGDPEQDYFTDGITEDIITELSRFHALFVVARNSSFSYKGKSPDIRQVGRELGVRYVLEGSIRRAGNRIRVTGQLIDTPTGHHIWAEKYDRVLEDIFAVQEELTQAIVAAIAPHISESELQRARGLRPSSIGTYQLALRATLAARVGYESAANSEARDAALRLAHEALAVDPRCSAALHVLAFVHWQHMYFGTARAPAQAFEPGIAAARLAIALDNGDHVAYRWRGHLLGYNGEYAQGLADLRRAHELNPNDAFTLSSLGLNEAGSGDPQKGIRCATDALRLSPRDPLRHWFLNNLAWAHFYGGNYALGVDVARGCLAEAPQLTPAQSCLAVCRVGTGDMAQARSDFQVLRQLAPEYVESRLSANWPTPHAGMQQRVSTFFRIAAGLEETGAADVLR